MSTSCLFAAVGLLLCVVAAVSANKRFAVLETDWTQCKPINSTPACYRTKEAVCVRNSDNRTAPWYYCTARPATIEVCLEGSCMQDCVVTEWTPWSVCNCETSLYRTRSRSLVIPPRNGGQPCPSLLEKEQCGECIARLSLDELPREYTWRTGQWGTCSLLSQATDCGPGRQDRSVDCVGKDSLRVSDSKCLNELAYSNVVPPPLSRLCFTPCNCLVTQWSGWSTCEPVCDDVPYSAQTRTRAIARQPTNGGTSCPHSLTETRECPGVAPVDCPRYFWNTSDWSDCSHQMDATCGAGQNTRFIFCIKEREDGAHENVALDSCVRLADTPRPSDTSACSTPCPQSCVLGAWSRWTECLPSCTSSYSNRTRDVLVPAQGSGRGCGHTVELRECPILSCFQFVPGPYSDCIVDLVLGCGSGFKSRNIMCKDVQGNTVSSITCLRHGLVVPINTESCYVPCPEDCVVSDWTEWTQCDHECGRGSGTQQRTRFLIADGSNCTHVNNTFKEERSCTLPTACGPPIIHVQTGVWGDCISQPLSSGDIPPLYSPVCDTGVQSHVSVCLAGDVIVSPADCPIEFSPTETRLCALPCPDECVYSPWSNYSECSVTCGSGTRSRTRRLVQFSEHCSGNSDGLEVQTASCDLPHCPLSGVYQWVGDNWSECEAFPGLQSVSALNMGTGCGHGYQTTPLECIDLSTAMTVPDVMCTQSAPPPTVQPCIVPCVDQCIVTHWSDFSICSNGFRNRTRVIICSDISNTCPHLSANFPLVESVPCPVVDLSVYGYAALTSYSSVIIESPRDVCGNGHRYRLIACVYSFGVPQPVDNEFCRLLTNTPASKQEGSIQCDSNCVQSEWSPWGECSTTCGQGHHNRTRRIIKEPKVGGRPCGHAVEIDVCHTQSCLFAEYIPGPYSTCLVSNTSSVCGEGVWTREPVCIVNQVIQSSSAECEKQRIQMDFELSEECYLPCIGECVVSAWGAWSPCVKNCNQNVCQRRRTRQRLRDGVFREECIMTQELETCDREMKVHMWWSEPWGNCILGLPVDDISPGSYCGHGVERRVVTCIDFQSGEQVYEGLCEGERPADEQSCVLPCPIDCVVSAFSDWTPCPDVCEVNKQQTRKREMITPHEYGGQMCPETVQCRGCSPTNCNEYSVVSHDSHCGLDLTTASQCGSAELVNVSSCQRNTRYVPMAECVQALQEGEEVSRVDRVTDSEGGCSLECPIAPDCPYSEWSEWSECRSACVDISSGFRHRKRTLLASLDDRAEECEREQYEQETCDVGTQEPDLTNDTVPFNTTMQTDCISFMWNSSVWNDLGTREVWCQTNTGLRVPSGCPDETRPLTERLACDSCPGFSNCDSTNTVCECTLLFERVESVCLPIFGCTLDDHCLDPNTVCMGEAGMCVCKNGYQLMNNDCVYIGPPTTQPTVTTEPMSATDDVDSIITMVTDPDTITTDPSLPINTSTQHVTTAEPSLRPDSSFGILQIALVSAVPMVVVIITVSILIIIMYRCHKSLENRQVKSDSLKHRTAVSISSPSTLTSSGEEVPHRLRGGESVSSGIVDDMDHEHFKYGMAGKTFLGSQRTGSPAQGDIDEAVFPSYAKSTPRLQPIPVSVPTLPGYHPNSDHTAQFVANLPDCDFTTDITTDEASVATTSVPPSSMGSPYFPQKYAHGQSYPDGSLMLLAPSQMTDNTYVSMHPMYSKVVPRSQRVPPADHREEVHSQGVSHDYRYVSHDHRGVPNEYQVYRDFPHDYREKSYDYRERSHDHRMQSPSHGRDVYAANGVYQSERDRYYARSNREKSFERVIDRDPELSPPLGSPPDPSSTFTTPRSTRNGSSSRDRRITAGLDNSLVQAIAQMSPQNRSSSVQSARTGGSRRSHRRSGRRRRHHGDSQNRSYHHNNRYRYNSDGPSDYEHGTSASEAEQPSNSHRYQSSRSAPISPIHGNDPNYDLLPPTLHIQPPTPVTTVRMTSLSPTGRPRAVEQLAVKNQIRSDYDYPRFYYTSQQPSAVQSPPSLPQSSTHPPPQSSTHLPPQSSTPIQSAGYEHLQTLPVANHQGPVCQGEPLVMDTSNSPSGSPFAGRRHHPPSPLAIHSSSFIDTSAGMPSPTKLNLRSSGEVERFESGQSNGHD